MAFIISGSPFPDFPRHPDSDTIKVESAIAAPGETIELPIYVKTIDTLTAFQISIETDPAYVTVDTLVALDSFLFDFSYCSGHIYACCFDEGILIGNPITLLPGEYHIADLTVTVNPEIEEPDTTQIVFSNDPELLHYTAFSNGPFFTPVTVDGEIQIITTGIENGENYNIPGKLSINAYPNPFNASTVIQYNLPKASEVVIEIYDIIGRRVQTLVDKYKHAGVHTLNFNASSLPSGVYFCRLQAGDAVETKSMVLLR
ncbi:MAG: T9SS type A sorting domain-containing protein, partial [Candidatus Zixiibacteriota bacterium]